MLVGAPRNCSRFACRYGFYERRLTFSLRTHISVLPYSKQYVTLAIVLSHSGERMHRDKIPPQRMHAACHIVTRGSCCAKRFAEFNGNCESYCSLEQLVVSLSVADEGKSAACVRIIRKKATTTPEDTCTNHPVGCIVEVHLDYN